MKVYPEKLAATVKARPAAFYMVSGDETLLIQESCEVIRLGLKQHGFDERELFHADAKFDWQEVLYSANSMSLFAEQKLIEVRIASGRPSDAGVKALQTFLAEPQEGTSLLLVLPRLDKKSQSTKWFKSLESASVFVQVWPIEKKDLPRWIGQRLRQAQLKASPEAIEILIDRVEGNLLAAVQEIERLKLLSSDGTVDANLVIESVSDNARFDVFGLIDVALSQDAKQAVRMFQGLKAEGVEISFILNMLARELRSLVKIAESVAAGQSQASAFGTARVWSNRKGLVSQCLKRHSLAKLSRYLRRVAEADKQFKGMAVGDPWIELEQVVFNLAGGSR